MQYKKKKIWLNNEKTKYCWVKLFADKLQMQAYYETACKERGLPDEGYYNIDGVSMHYERYIDGVNLSNQTGEVLLCFQRCNADVVTHELLHAVLWARGHKEGKKQYPIIIRSMKQEEEILWNHSYAVFQFYEWYHSIKNLFQKRIKN